MDIEIRFRIRLQTGSAIGLGRFGSSRIWPELEGAFFLIFIGFTLLIGLPLLLAEFVIGRSTQKRPLMRIEKLHQKHYGHG